MATIEVETIKHSFTHNLSFHIYAAQLLPDHCESLLTDKILGLIQSFILHELYRICVAVRSIKQSPFLNIDYRALHPKIINFPASKLAEK